MGLKCNKKIISWKKSLVKKIISLYLFEYLNVYIVIVTNWSIDK